MRETAGLRGLELTSRSRPLKPEDLTQFDYILGMDFANMALMQLAADHWAETKPIPKGYRDKVGIVLVSAYAALLDFHACIQCLYACILCILPWHSSFLSYAWQVKLICSFMPEASQFKGVMEVPDPYFDDDKDRRGFHRVLDLLNDACQGLLEAAVTEHNLQA